MILELDDVIELQQFSSVATSVVGVQGEHE